MQIIQTWAKAKVLIAFCLTLGSLQAHADMLYGLSDNPVGNQYFYSIDTATGAATQIGTTSYGGGSLAFAPNGTLYDGAYGQLWDINTSTGTFSVVSTFKVPTEVDYIGFDQNGNLYGIDNTNSVLYHLNPNTGSVLGTVFLNGASGAVLTGFVPGPDGTLIGSTTGGAVYDVNPTTGVVTAASFSVPGSPRANTNIAEGQSGTFYREVVGGGVSTLYATNATSAVTTEIGSTAQTLPNIDFEQIAADPVPLPASVLLLLSGLIAIGPMLRKRQTI